MKLLISLQGKDNVWVPVVKLNRRTAHVRLEDGNVVDRHLAKHVVDAEMTEDDLDAITAAGGSVNYGNNRMTFNV